MGEKTITVKRANVILDISPDEKEFYMSKGYSVISEDGKVVEEAMSNDVKVLQLQNITLKQKVAELENEIAKLKSAAKPGRKTAEKE